VTLLHGSCTWLAMLLLLQVQQLLLADAVS
jgi:hypothetical protein